MRIRDILNEKGTSVVTAAPGDSILEAMRVLVRHRIGAVVVLQGGSIAGILSERDVLRTGAEDPSRLNTLRVEEVMTRKVVVGTVDDDLNHVMNVMTENRIRHLPVVADGSLAGIVSIGDVVNACRRVAEGENRHLRDYIQGVSA